MAEQVKVIYFAPRPEGRSLEDFRARWREHGKLGMSLPLWEWIGRYKQLDALTPEESGLPLEGIAATAEDRLGGVGQIWVRSDEAMAKIWADPDVRRMEVDEEETFGRKLGTLQLPTRETVVIDRGVPAAFSFQSIIHRTAGVSREEFSDGWADSGAKFAESPEFTDHLSFYIQNRVMEGSDEADGVVELGFPSVAEAAAFFAEPRLGEWLIPYEASFVDHARMVSLVTRENLLYDDPAMVATSGAVGAA
jgi:hypothetical protein